MWEAKLEELITSGNYSIRGIGLLLRCDPKTVVKYTDKLGIKQLLNTDMNISYKKVNEKSTKVDLYQYRMEIMNLINSNSKITRSQIRDTLSKEYIWLYKNDRDWFDSNMPKKQKSSTKNKSDQDLWELKDCKVLELLKNEYDALTKINSNVRITRTLLGRRIGMLAELEKNLDKLPRTKKYLTEIIESVGDFQLRRVDNVCLQLFEEGEELKKWKITRQAGLKTNLSKEIENQIEVNMMKYNKLVVL